MDILDDILDTLNMKGVFYFRTDFSPPWGVKVPQLEQTARFHLVVEGTCYIQFPSGDSAYLNAGDLVLIPHGATHSISCTPETPICDLETALTTAGYKNDGVLVVGDGDPTATTQLICGHFSFRKDADHPLLRALPDHMLVTASDRARNQWLDETLRLVVRCVFAENLGGVTTVTRLSEIVFIELLRTGVIMNAEFNAVLKAFTDGQIGRALLYIHQNLAEPWTVASLASEVGMSRSRFAERFSDLVGTGPMSYLSDWRLQKALALLDTSRYSVQEVSGQIGYLSPAAFTRAFSGKFGVSPTHYRRNLY